MNPTTEENRVTTQRSTRVLQVDASKIGEFIFENPKLGFLEDWNLHLSEDSADVANLREAASLLQDADIPVAFPTETVYGLGADATRSSAVCGIYNAKQRPTDNPLIVHVSCLRQLRRLLSPHYSSKDIDPIPEKYHPLIERFWPGPLTILLPLPTPSPLAAEVTTSLPTFAVRMPSSKLALALIQVADRPLAAPSANASSKPSPTTAAHVLHDLNGRIDLILDGGPCTVGVESTVVDGLVDPPVILRPGGISLEMLRDVPEWKDVRVAYKDAAVEETPRAPGMKYKHYSPNARVLIVHGNIDADVVMQNFAGAKTVGLLKTKSLKSYDRPCASYKIGESFRDIWEDEEIRRSAEVSMERIKAMAESPTQIPPIAQHSQFGLASGGWTIDFWTIQLGHDIADVARGLFSALRELDSRNVEVIFVEAVNEEEGGAGAAVMNRLRKAAEFEIRP